MKNIKHNLYGIYILMATLLIACQNTPVQVPELPVVDTLSRTACVYDKSYRNPNSTFPFNTAGRIEIVSYPKRKDAFTNHALVVNRRLMLENIRERVALNGQQTDTLFSILYDYKFRKKGAVKRVSSCYDPRHAILFYSNEKPYAYLEICLECGETRHTKNTDFGDFCDEKVCMLQRFFKDLGVRQGFPDSGCD